MQDPTQNSQCGWEFAMPSHMLTVDGLVTKCMFCQLEDETRDHIYVECHYATCLGIKLLNRMELYYVMATAFNGLCNTQKEDQNSKSSEGKACG